MKEVMRKSGILGSVLLALSGCQQGHDVATTPSGPKSGPSIGLSSERGKILAHVAAFRSRFPQGFSMEQLKEHILEGDLQKASRYVNSALRNVPQNALLHLVNGFIYEEMERVGDTSVGGLIEVAYARAYNLDPSSWYTAFLLGKHYLTRRDHRMAQKLLSNALLLRPDDPDILYSLSYASYYVRDLPVAIASIRKAVMLKPSDPMIVRAASIIFASIGHDKKAREYLKAYERLMGKGGEDVTFIAGRLNDWKKTHAQALKRVPCNGSQQSKEKPSDEKAGAQKGNDPKSKAVVFDLYTLRMSENVTTTKGTNVVSAIGSVVMQMGGASQPNGSGWTRTTKVPIRGSNNAFPDQNFIQRTFNFSVTQAGLLYNVNIMNAADTVVEIVGRPTIAAMVGQKADFYSGNRVQGFTRGNTGGSSVTVDTGTKLTLTPQEITTDGKVVVKVGISGVVLLSQPVFGVYVPDPENPGLCGIGAQTINTGDATADTTVKSRFDETTVIAGMYERRQQTIKTGFPLLQDIPFVQYFFANEKTESVVKTVLYLITPRKLSRLKACEKNFSECSLRSTATAQYLEQKGSLAFVEDYTSLHYIIKHLLNKPAFFDFRSGDVLPPMWGGACVRLDRKLDQLAAFLYF